MKLICPRTQRTIRTSRWRSDATLSLATGMKSTTSPTPASVKNRVTRTAVSGKYSCLLVYTSTDGRIRK